jgi:hypothetical protein
MTRDHFDPDRWVTDWLQSGGNIFVTSDQRVTIGAPLDSNFRWQQSLMDKLHAKGWDGRRNMVKRVAIERAGEVGHVC